MAYIIYNNDGSVLLTLPDGEVDTVTTSLTLVGKNVNNYGEYINNNFTKLLTSFAGPNIPAGSAQTGQLWFDTSEDRLKVYDGDEFTPTYGATISNEPPAYTATGDLWYDIDRGQLNIWYEAPDSLTTSNWVLIGPSTPIHLGKFGIEPLPEGYTIKDQFNDSQKVSIIYSYSSPIGLMTTSTFDMLPADSEYYFGESTSTTIVKGVTFVDDVSIRGNLFINGHTRSDKSLTTYFDVSSWPDILDPGISESDRYVSFNATNTILTDVVLESMFPTTSTNSTHYAENSEVKVLTQYTSTSSVSLSIRHFKLEEFPANGGQLNWRPVDTNVTGLFPTLQTSTNIITTSTTVF